MPFIKFTAPSLVRGFLSAYIALFFLTNCEDPSDFGQNLLTNTPIDMVLVDTLTVKTSTVLLDSISTGLSGSGLFGRYIDPIFGSVEARTNFQFVPQTDKYTLPATAIYDSLVVIMPYNSWYADTLKSTRIQIHRLTGDLEQKRTYQSNNTIGYEPIPLATKDFTPVLHTKVRASTTDTTAFAYLFDTLKVKMPATFGRELFIKADKPETATKDLFVNYFKGFQINAGNIQNASILGFSMNGFVMRMYYHTDTDGIILQSYYDFRTYINDATTGVLSYSGANFVQVITNRAGTVLQSIKNPLVSIPTTTTGGKGFLHSMGGLALKVEIPYLKKLKEKTILIPNRTELVIPVEYDKSLPYATPALYMAETNATNILSRNTLGTPLFIPSDNGASLLPLASSASTAQITGRNTTTNNYTFLINSYVQAVLSGVRNGDGWLIIPATSYNVERAVIKSSDIKLRMYYTYIKTSGS